MDLKYTSIILSKRDVAETDRIYNFYTLEEGRVRAMGRGVRKPNAKLAGSLEPLTLAEIHVSKRNGLGNITGAIGIDNFSGLKNNFAAVSQAFRALNHFEKLVNQQERDERIFELLKSYLEALEALDREAKAEYKFGLVTSGFLFKLMENLGYMIQAEKCARCGGAISAGDQNFFSGKRGGLLCPECARTESRKVRCSDSTIKLLRIFLWNPIGNIAKVEVAEKDLRELELIWRELAEWI